MPRLLRSAPSKFQSARYVFPRHLMKSSSIPPAVVTIAETCLCFTRYRITSLRPDEIKLDVYPRKTLHRVWARTSGDWYSSDSSSVKGSSESRHWRWSVQRSSLTGSVSRNGEPGWPFCWLCWPLDQSSSPENLFAHNCPTNLAGPANCQSSVLPRIWRSPVQVLRVAGRLLKRQTVRFRCSLNDSFRFYLDKGVDWFDQCLWSKERVESSRLDTAKFEWFLRSSMQLPTLAGQVHSSCISLL